MRDFTLGEFIESLANGEESTQDEKKREQEHEIEMEFEKMVDELINSVMETVDEDFVKCEKARERTFLEREEDYHSAIEALIKRPLSIEETTVADVSFELAFIDGWCAHKEYGDNNDK